MRGKGYSDSSLGKHSAHHNRSKMKKQGKSSENQLSKLVAPQDVDVESSPEQSILTLLSPEDYQRFHSASNKKEEGQAMRPFIPKFDLGSIRTGNKQGNEGFKIQGEFTLNSTNKDGLVSSNQGTSKAPFTFSETAKERSGETSAKFTTKTIHVTSLGKAN